MYSSNAVRYLALHVIRLDNSSFFLSSRLELDLSYRLIVYFMVDISRSSIKRQYICNTNDTKHYIGMTSSTLKERYRNLICVGTKQTNFEIMVKDKEETWACGRSNSMHFFLCLAYLPEIYFC